jgi:hypothetical protein
MNLDLEWKNSGECVSEISVGIERHANATEGFLSIHKQRFSDFIVREGIQHFNCYDL